MSFDQSPLIISFASPKGGVGKSSACLAIAGALAARQYPVHIMDLDQNCTIADWYDEHRPPIANLTVERTAEADFMARLKTLYHQRTGFILVDVAGVLTDVMIQAATIAHLTITPAKLSGSDVKKATDLHHRLIEAGRYAGKG
ncbi:MAG: ParA family protein, partial [Hyphomicrobiaceae bacterium]